MVTTNTFCAKHVDKPPPAYCLLYFVVLWTYTISPTVQHKWHWPYNEAPSCWLSRTAVWAVGTDTSDAGSSAWPLMDDSDRFSESVASWVSDLCVTDASCNGAISMCWTPAPCLWNGDFTRCKMVKKSVAGWWTVQWERSPGIDL